VPTGQYTAMSMGREAISINQWAVSLGLRAVMGWSGHNGNIQIGGRTEYGGISCYSTQSVRLGLWVSRALVVIASAMANSRLEVDGERREG